MKQHMQRTDMRHIRKRKRLFIFCIVSLCILALYLYGRKPSLFPRDVILQSPTATKNIDRRYILFTQPINSGEWPQDFDTKERLLLSTNQGYGSVASQIYTGIPRNSGNSINSRPQEHIFAMATDSTHILAEDFLPKFYLQNVDSTLLLVLGPLDPQELQTVTDHLSKSNIKTIVIKIPVEDREQRKFELLSTLIEFTRYDEGTAKYYTILDDDVFLPASTTFMSLISQYNSIESHIIADTAFKEESNFSPITFTAALLNRLFANDEIWSKCASMSKSITTGSSKIRNCVAIAQGQSSSQARFDSESLSIREVSGSVAGLLESGVQPLSYRPNRLQIPHDLNKAEFDTLVMGMSNMNTSELFARYVFRENDEIQWVYCHGLSMTHYPKGIAEKQLRLAEVTWTRKPDETPARDAPYYRDKMTAENKLSYWLHSVQPHTEYTYIDGKRVEVKWSSFVYRNEQGRDIEIDWVISG